MKNEINILIAQASLVLIIWLWFFRSQSWDWGLDILIMGLVLAMITLVPTLISFRLKLAHKKVFFYIIFGLTILVPIILLTFDEWKRNNIVLNFGFELILLLILVLPAIASFIYSFRTKNELFYSSLIGINFLALLLLTIFLILPNT